MKVIADLHIHSRFSMATSKALNPSSLDRWAGIKGLDLLGAGDCTHPAWLRELRDNLEEAEEGLYTLKGGGPRFVLTGEISTIYKKGDKTRKVHHLVLLPDFSAAERLQAKLERVGNIRSDGRPILGLDSRDLLAVLMEADSRSILIPAHIWTPWFSVLGAKSGFDRVDECYGDLAGLIPAVETGLSSNPPMNWALSSLDRYGVISNSDAHSPEKLGREATIFEMDLSYPSLGDALWRRNGADILGTVEFFPQEGKYHYDGHRKCGVVVNPEDIADGLCPVCGKPLTMGVMRRVLALADRPVDEWAPCPPDFAGTNRRPYFSLIPLREILGELLNTGAGSKKVDLAYRALIDQAGSELRLLMDSPLPDIQNYRVPGAGGEALAEAVSRMRGGQVSVRPGYDGEYGVIRVFPAGDGAQSPLFDAGEGEPLRRAAAPRAPVSGREPGAPHAAPAPESAAPSAAAFSPDGAQQRAIAYEGPAALILAGPGTGKTAVLTARIKRLLERGVDPASILAVTFTNRAARELRDRAGGAVNAATFHSFCAAFLREEGPFPRDFAILGEAERDALLRDICNSAPGKITFRGLGDYIEERKRFLLLPGETLPALGPEQGDLVTIAQSLGLPEPIPERDALYGVYQERLAARRALDFDGLLARTVRLLADSPGVRAQTQGRFRFIFVDEYQDVNFAQYALLRLLTHPGTAPGGGQKLWVIGDPNQAIYGFRGSDKRLIDRFTADYPEAAQFYLGRSFRCASPIAAAAGALVDAPLEGAAGEVSLFRSEYPSDASEA
ncbi:MAG: UvrD-helicase domain-containing protein, partial [Spirochaetaceae bacterium]|nr:UvrD-helicase domain-containing protein [Spirochaetaceae bacterium]